jgi:Flp pilus assembly protein TadD
MNEQIQQEFNHLPDKVRWTLERADGYMDLRMWPQAEKELARIPKPHRTASPVQQGRLRLTLELREWAPAESLARTLQERMPEDPSFWIQLAYATRRNRTIDDAVAILEEAMNKFPGEAIIPYNLACYACRSGDVTKAGNLLEKVFDMDDAFRLIARQDKDLEPLWDVFEED